MGLKDFGIEFLIYKSVKSYVLTF